MSNDQPQPTQAPAPQQKEADPGQEFAKRGALATISGAVSGTVRELWNHVFNGDE